MAFSTNDLAKVWGLVKISLEKHFPKAQYKAWIEKSTKLIKFKDQKAIVGVPNGVVKRWLEGNAKYKISHVLSELLGTNISVEFKVSPASFRKKKQIEGAISLFDPSAKYSEQVRRALEKANVNPRFSFETFIVGPNNRLAYAAAQAVAESLGDMYNPLFIYGPVGVGKTHLMQAIAHKILQKNPSSKVYYCSSETFLNEMVESIREGKSSKFRNQYRQLDLLLIDDIQFISKWQSTQDELFHTFNTLYNAGKQIVFVSDRPPGQINGLADRLRSRFEGGMVIDILPPDFETRLAILERLNQQKHVKLPQELLERIAMIVTDNVRSLIGAYNKLHSYFKLNQHINPDEVEGVLGFGSEQLRANLSPEVVIKEVASAFNIQPQQLKSGARHAYLVLPRQVAMYLIRSMLNLSLKETAASLGRKDHTTVLHALRKVETLAQNDKRFYHQLVQLKSKILSR